LTFTGRRYVYVVRVAATVRPPAVPLILAVPRTVFLVAPRNRRLLLHFFFVRPVVGYRRTVHRRRRHGWSFLDDGAAEPAHDRQRVSARSRTRPTGSLLAFRSASIAVVAIVRVLRRTRAAAGPVGRRLRRSFVTDVATAVADDRGVVVRHVDGNDGHDGTFVVRHDDSDRNRFERTINSHGMDDKQQRRLSDTFSSLRTPCYRANYFVGQPISSGQRRKAVKPKR